MTAVEVHLPRTEATRAELAALGVEVSMVLSTVVRTELAAGVPAAQV